MSGKIKNEIFEWFKTICASLVIAFGVTLFVQPTIVSGQSMYPTLEDKDYLLINKLSYNKEIPNRGDILVFKSGLIDNKTSHKKNLVKRVIALPGEHILIKNNEVYINGKYLSEDYLNDVYTDGDIDIVVPNNHVFTMGDNRPNSGDSRDSKIGTVPLDDIIGKVALRAYPFNKFGKIK